jgi:hypothetical protein
MDVARDSHLPLHTFERSTGSIALVSAGGGDRKIEAGRDLPQGFEILRIPIAHILSRRDLEKHCHFLRPLMSEDLKESLMGYCVAYLTEQGFSHPALKLLQDKCEIFQDFADELQVLPPQSWEIYLEHFAEENLRFQRISSHLETRFARVSYSHYLWGVCQIRTRAFKPPKEAAHILGSHNLIPTGDLFQHSSSPNVEYSHRIMTKQKAVVVNVEWSYRTTTAVTKGTELTISYLCRSKLDLLAIYGFVDDSPLDLACMSLILRDKFLQISPEDQRVYYGNSIARADLLLPLIDEELTLYRASFDRATERIQRLITAHIEFLDLVRTRLKAEKNEL